MTIKAIAVDMDGTFLNSHQDYDREGFKPLFKTLEEKNIRFIVASGNQYAQLKSFFPEDYKSIVFVAENGGVIVLDGRLSAKKTFSKHLLEEIITFLHEKYGETTVILCGPETAYIQSSAPDYAQEFADRHYYALERVDALKDHINEPIVKVALVLPDEMVDEVKTNIAKVFAQDALTAVTSGFGCIDLIIPRQHKGSSIEALLKDWDVHSDELMAFGDSENDLEMLKLAKYSYAMANGSEKVKKAARFEAPSNDDNGVFKTIEQFLK